MANRIVVPNDYLADYSRRFNASVTVVPEAEDTDRFTPRSSHRNSATLWIGWVGSPSTAKYLRLIEPALREVCRRYPQVVVRTIGGRFEADGVRTEYRDWSLSQEVENFHALDVGVMPLPLEEWSKGKSGCKLRQYMASGVPGVATRIGYNCELVEHGNTGFLVETQEEWIQALSRLIEDAELRNQISARARRSVVERFSIPVIGPQLVDVIEKTVVEKGTTSARRASFEIAHFQGP
jgi:glycosyltransferase involved in cell wall biosynthesis